MEAAPPTKTRSPRRLSSMRGCGLMEARSWVGSDEACCDSVGVVSCSGRDSEGEMGLNISGASLGPPSRRPGRTGPGCLPATQAVLSALEASTRLASVEPPSEPTLPSDLDPRGRKVMVQELPIPRRTQCAQGVVPLHRRLASLQKLHASAALWRWLGRSFGRGIW
jgi:hypothetical protein